MRVSHPPLALYDYTLSEDPAQTRAKFPARRTPRLDRPIASVRCAAVRPVTADRDRPIHALVNNGWPPVAATIRDSTGIRDSAPEHRSSSLARATNYYRRYREGSVRDMHSDDDGQARLTCVLKARKINAHLFPRVRAPSLTTARARANRTCGSRMTG